MLNYFNVYMYVPEVPATRLQMKIFSCLFYSCGLFFPRVYLLKYGLKN